jgi:hypothetical protein
MNKTNQERRPIMPRNNHVTNNRQKIHHSTEPVAQYMEGSVIQWERRSVLTTPQEKQRRWPLAMPDSPCLPQVGRTQ